MARKKLKPSLPTQGAAFAVPLEDHRYSVCRVLLDASSEQSKQWKSETILVAGSAWIGVNVPNADEPALRPILRLNHHSWRGRSNVLWVSGQPPDDFIPIGSIQPTSEEQAIPSPSFGGWETFALQPLAQWRWDNERDTVRAEDLIRETKDAERGENAQREREEYLSRITLEQLRDRRFFGHWKDYPPANAIRASRDLMTRTVQRLIELGPGASPDARMAVLQQCIESFNQLDAEMSFIETTEREDICQEFEAVVHACGLGAHKDLADEWREW
ncbi:MAG: hypothetical protein WD847_03055 [Pirellulales bacterium]